MTDYEAKQADVAKILDGQIVHDEERVQVCVKGIVLGFPATLEAIRATFPFGVTYFLETNLVVNPAAKQDDPLKLVITPRLARGFFAFISRLLVFEARGQKLELPQLDSAFVASFNRIDLARRLVGYPGMQGKLLDLAECTHFSELLIKTDAGICLSQSVSFNALDLDVLRETFRLLGEIGQIIVSAFS